MSASVAKKPPSGRETPTGTPSRPTTRGTPASSGTGGAGSTARARPMRSGTHVSARAAAASPAGRRESPLSNGAGAHTTDSEDEARGEMVGALDDLKTRLAEAETESDQHRRSAEVLQTRLDEALGEQARLEEKLQEAEENIEALANEKLQESRRIRELETIYESESSAWHKEKEAATNREEEMQTIIQRLKDTLAQRNVNEDESRSSRHSGTSSPTVEQSGFAPPSSTQRSDPPNNSKLVLQKDKLIETLRLELADAQIKLVESENQGGGRLQEVERLLMEARMANARYMEENESYQLLLQEKTLKGDFGAGGFPFMASSAPSNQDALAALEGRAGGTSLADELSEAVDPDNAEVDSDAVRRLEVELKSAKDQNKALTLYINKIIERLLLQPDFEHILDQSSDYSRPVPQRQSSSGSSILQRAKTFAGVSGPKPRPRPMTYMPPAREEPEPSALSNPDTAPSIPIGLTRSTSTRRGRPMSEQFTGGAASVVNAMFSPPLRSGFGAGGRASPPATSGNFPGMRSETSSTSGEGESVRASSASVNGIVVGGDVSTPPGQSPPRSHYEKPSKFAGNKPRALRLVQENPDSVPQNNVNKRQSWMGWASSAASTALASAAAAAAAASKNLEEA